MTPALLSLAEGQGTRDSLIARIVTARRINQTVGGLLVAPWELDELPDEWLDAFMGMGSDLASFREGKAKVEDIFSKWRNAHKDYKVRH